MKNKNNGFIAQGIIALIAILIIGGGAYYAGTKKANAPTLKPEENLAKDPSQITYEQILAEKKLQAKNIRDALDKSTTSNWKTYTDPEYGFSFQYPTEYKLNTKPELQPYVDYKVTQIASVSTKENYLDSSEFQVTADNGATNLKACLTGTSGSDIQAKNSMSKRVINGNTFYIIHDKTSDAAMGGARGEVSQFAIIRDNYCYWLSFHIYWHEVGFAGYINTGVNNATAEQKQGQLDAIGRHEAILDRILSSLEFSN